MGLSTQNVFQHLLGLYVTAAQRQRHTLLSAPCPIKYLREPFISFSFFSLYYVIDKVSTSPKYFPSIKVCILPVHKFFLHPLSLSYPVLCQDIYQQTFLQFASPQMNQYYPVLFRLTLVFLVLRLHNFL